MALVDILREQAKWRRYAELTFTGGGGGTPGGVDTEVQFNNSGAFGGFGSWDGTKFSLDTLEKFNINSQAADVVDLTADSGSLQIGNVAGIHIAIDRNTIQAKTNGTTAGTLNLMNFGGSVVCGNGVDLTSFEIQTATFNLPNGVFSFGAPSTRVLFVENLGDLEITIENGGNIRILDGNTGNTERYVFDVDTGALQMDGNLDLAYIDGYAGTPADGEVLTWVTANGRAEFLPGGGGSVSTLVSPVEITGSALGSANISTIDFNTSAGAGDSQLTIGMVINGNNLTDIVNHEINGQIRIGTDDPSASTGATFLVGNTTYGSFTGNRLQLTTDCDLWFQERADHASTLPVAGIGALWVRNDSPCVLVFTDDAGTDTVLGAGGGIGGSIANDQVAVGTGVDTIGGDSQLTFDGNTLLLSAGNDMGMSLNSELRFGSAPAAGTYNHRFYAPGTTITYCLGDVTFFWGRDNLLELMRITPGSTTRGGPKFINMGYQADEVSASALVLDDGTHHYKQSVASDQTFTFTENFWQGNDQVYQFWFELENTTARNHTWPSDVEWDSRSGHDKAAADAAGRHLLYFVWRRESPGTSRYIATVLAQNVS